MLDEIRRRILLLWLGLMNVSPITQPVPTSTAEEHQMLGTWKPNAPARLTCAPTNRVGLRKHVFSQLLRTEPRHTL